MIKRLARTMTKARSAFTRLGSVPTSILYPLTFLFVTCILLLIWLRPHALALYHQVRGGMILRDILRASQQDSPNSFACDLEPVHGDPDRARLRQAIDHLEAAKSYDPHLAQTYLMLGRAYCLYGERDNAISAYRAYTKLQPNNPLGHLELGLLSALAGHRMADTEWQAAGTSLDQIIAQAEQAFKAKSYLIAANRYRQSAASINELPFAVYIRWVIAATVSKQELPESAFQNLPVYPIAELGKTRIEAENFRWLREVESSNVTYGDRLIDHPGNDQTVAWMWWSGDAVIIIQAPASGKYTIAIRTQNTLPPPVKMNLTIDLEPVYPFEMERGDMSWQEFQTDAVLSAGFHVVGLSYLNNAIIDGKDRDAVIDWVELEKIDKE